MTDVNDQSNAAVASYSYDYAGRRVLKTVYGSPDVTTKYCYDAADISAAVVLSTFLLFSMFTRLTAELSGGANPWLTLELAQSTVKYERNC